MDVYNTLGVKPDQRNYDNVITILTHFNIKKVRLMSNNPQKIEALRKTGIEVKVISSDAPLDKYNKMELAKKKENF